MSLSGKVVLITGGGGGKGLALAQRFARESAIVIITDIMEEGGRANVAVVGNASEFRQLDVTSEEDWADTVAHVIARHGRIDLLVNSARTHTRSNDLATTSLDAWRRQVSVNLDGAFLGMKHCLPPMRANGGGAIINVVSLSAVAPFAPTPCYSACHAALLNLTRTTAVNCARAADNIRVNAVVCGMSVNSPVGEIMELARQLIPLGRPAYADDIADAIVWLASENARYVTGSSITLDGGYTAEAYPGA